MSPVAKALLNTQRTAKLHVHLVAYRFVMSSSSSGENGFSKINNHQLYYKIQGDGAHLMIITGTNSDTRHKPSIYDAPGASEFELLNFDHRGMGQSTRPNEDPTMESYADDIAILLDNLGWDHTAVMGVSFGGMVAQHFALRHPNRVSKLVLCCTSSGGDGGSSYPLQTLQNLSAEEYATTIMKLMNVEHTDEWQSHHPKLAKRTFDYYWQGADATFNDPEKHAAMKKQFATRATHNVYENLKTMKIPTLVACGKYDGIALPENSKAIADVIPEAQLKIFKGGHMFLKEDPTAWPTVFGFLKNHQ